MIIDSILIIDCFLKFFIANEEDDIYTKKFPREISPPKVMLSYLKKYFLINLLATLPSLITKE